jgi:ribosomal protein L11 methylase PrmA
VDQISLPSGTVDWQGPPAQYVAAAISADGSTGLLAANNLSEGGGSGVLLVTVATDVAGGSIALDSDPVAVVYAP